MNKERKRNVALHLLNIILGIVLGIGILCIILGAAFWQSGLNPSDTSYDEYMNEVYRLSEIYQHNSHKILIVLYCILWIYLIIREFLIAKEKFWKILLKNSIWLVAITASVIYMISSWSAYYNYSNPGNTLLEYLMMLSSIVTTCTILFLYSLLRLKKGLFLSIISAVCATLFGVFICIFVYIARSIDGFAVMSMPVHNIGIIQVIQNLYTKSHMIVTLGFIIIAILFVYIFEGITIKFKNKIFSFPGILNVVAGLAMLFSWVLLHSSFAKTVYDLETSYLLGRHSQSVGSHIIHFTHIGQICVGRDRWTIQYPFFCKDITPMLRRLACELKSKPMVEYYDLIRYACILKVLAYGKSDTIIYNRLRSIIQQNSVPWKDYLMSHWLKYRKIIRPWSSNDEIAKVIQRYAEEKHCTFKGWVYVNGKPSDAIRFYLYKVEPGSTPSIARVVWGEQVDKNGKIEFDYSGIKDTYQRPYYGVALTFPSKIDIREMNYLKINRIINDLPESTGYFLDTMNINYVIEPGKKYFRYIEILPKFQLDSFELFIPFVGESTEVELEFETQESGEINTIAYPSWGLGSILTDAEKDTIEKALKESRFYLKSPGKVYILINCHIQML